MKTKLMNVYNGVKGKVEKHSPEILMGVGVAGVITTTVMACRATLPLTPLYTFINFVFIINTLL